LNRSNQGGSNRTLLFCPLYRWVKGANHLDPSPLLLQLRPRRPQTAQK
jgi:hypothetical protein